MTTKWMQWEWCNKQGNVWLWALATWLGSLRWCLLLTCDYKMNKIGIKNHEYLKNREQSKEVWSYWINLMSQYTSNNRMLLAICFSENSENREHTILYFLLSHISYLICCIVGLRFFVSFFLHYYETAIQYLQLGNGLTPLVGKQIQL